MKCLVEDTYIVLDNSLSAHQHGKDVQIETKKGSIPFVKSCASFIVEAFVEYARIVLDIFEPEKTKVRDPL
eukprot:Awhi_evm2s11514